MNMNTNQTKLHTLGIDIGSTTVKVAILNEKNELLFSDYECQYPGDALCTSEKSI